VAENGEVVPPVPTVSAVGTTVTEVMMDVDTTNLIVGTDTAAPLTWTPPEVGDATYPVTVPTVKPYVPFLIEKAILAVDEDFCDPLKVTDQLTPLASPDSVKVTL
jgi:hypothetical protein